MLNASNEVAVENFLKANISFNDIVNIINKTIKKFSHDKISSIDDVVTADHEARKLANSIIREII